MRKKYVDKITVTIGDSQYKCVKAVTGDSGCLSCKGCAFEHECYSVPRKRECPMFGKFKLAICIGAIYKKIKGGVK